jgi:CubicO group peptidase (beta-lactamase class C family)
MPAPAEAVAELGRRFESTLATFVRDQRLPGAAAGVVVGDRLVWSGGYGFADVAARRAPDAHTLYRIASITKTFTATAVLQLRDLGRLDLDDPIIAHVPELRAAASSFGPIESVTIRRLLSHESGLVGDPPGTDWTLRRYEGDIAANLARVTEIGTMVPPNTQQKYSNLGYQLLGEIVARVSGLPYAEYLFANVLGPLGMASTAFEPLANELAERRAVGYDPRWMSDELDEARPIPSVLAEGGLWSCVEDLARWIAAHVREDGGDRGGDQVLSGRTLREMHRPRYLGDETWSEAWCIGWYARRKDGVTWVQHSGGLPGFVTNVCFERTSKVGAIALVNGEGKASDLAMEIGAIALEAATKAVVPAEPPVRTPEAYRDLLGLYGAADDGLLFRVEWRDGALAVIDPAEPDWRPTLEPSDGPDRFVVSAGWRESGEPAIFERRADGRVVSVTIGPFSLARFDPVDQ